MQKLGRTHGSRRVALGTIVVAGMLMQGIGAGAPIDSDKDVVQYATGCFSKDVLGVTIDEFVEEYGESHLDCARKGRAVELSTHWTPRGGTGGPNGCTKGCDLVDWARNHPREPWPGTTTTPRAAFPPQCDRPVWLDKKCYGNSFVQRIEMKDGVVKAVLLCRHKERFADTSNKYDDIAMIVHNSDNGNTCWFQSNLDRKQNGRDVPFPMPPSSAKDKRRALSRAKQFWFAPARTAAQDCSDCHDNGPWMNSYWIREAKIIHGKKIKQIVPDDNAGEKYVNPGAAFKAFKPVFVELKNDQTCTTCHNISGAKNSHSLSEWIDFVTAGGIRMNGKEIEKHDRFPAKLDDYGKDLTPWMPVGFKGAGEPAPGITPKNAADRVKLVRNAWDKEYEKTILALKRCMEWSAGPRDKKAPENCEATP